MGNRWHVDQDNDMRPDIKAEPCPWCNSTSIVVDSTMVESNSRILWGAVTSCHDCSACGPDQFITSFPDHPLHIFHGEIDWEDERKVVNFAIRIWNSRF